MSESGTGRGRTLLRATLALAAAFGTVAVAGGWLAGWREVRANGLVELGYRHAAADVVRSEVWHALRLASLVAVPAWTALAVAVVRRARLRLPGALALAGWIAFAPLVGGLWWDWRVSRVRAGVDLPTILWRTSALATWAAIAAAGVAVGLVLAFGVDRRRRLGEAAGRIGTRALAALVAVAIAGAAASELWAGRIARPRPSNGRSVVYLTWDSTRADHLSCYGYERETTPRLDAIAADSVVYERAYSQHNVTRASYSSILTSRQPWERESRVLEREHAVLAEMLRDAGYDTHAIVQNPHLDPFFEFDQGFDSYVQVHGEEPPEPVVERALERIDSLAAGGRPFFLMVHLQTPHWPYSLDGPFVELFREARDELVGRKEMNELMRQRLGDWDPDDPVYRAKLEWLVDMYDADLRYADHALGRIVDRLRERGLLDEVLLVFNSDHGDEFLERGAFGHGHRNYHQELTRVPLLFRYPSEMGIDPRRVRHLAQNLDVVPTVLDALDVEVPTPVSGRSLLSLTPDEARERAVLSGFRRSLAVRIPGHTLHLDLRGGVDFEFYDLSDGLAELEPGELDHSDPDVARCIEIFRAWRERSDSFDDGAGEEGELDEMAGGLRRELEALGYL